MGQKIYSLIKFSQSYKVGIITFPSLHMRKLEHREIN